MKTEREEAFVWLCGRFGENTAKTYVESLTTLILSERAASERRGAERMLSMASRECQIIINGVHPDNGLVASEIIRNVTKARDAIRALCVSEQESNEAAFDRTIP